MTKRIFTLTLAMLLLCACSGRMPSAEPVVELSPNPSTSSNPSVSPPVLEPPSQTHTSEPTEAIDAEVIEYAAIIGFYRDFMRYDEKTEDVINNLFDNVANELNLNNERKEYELWCSCVEARTGNLGYAIRDINSDGIPELFILSEDYLIHAVYSLHNGTPVLVGGYWSRHSCVIDEAGTFYINASGGASDSYSASYLFVSGNEELQLIEMVGRESYDEQTGENFPEPQCYRVQNGEKTIIDYEEARIMWEKFPNVYPDNPTKDAGLIYVPLLN